ncbi:flavin reductase family protein [Flavobacteriaceae bacterium]|jgi:flavin reductase (DIM6/NTAB) family NADH-FMN oxidoreductase RutF|nr:flavin reductase family protein [Flavobacteriaceae bacterium]MDG1722575.1 flavin reductase family protein [Flavobacteriaceae bacterium]MDG2290728.1 flavin reductase family protein [Flavobacteriaceae bacterium]
MIHYSRTDIDQMDKIFRLNLINSCTGFKSANLLGTKSLNGVSNVAVFSSITHLGSNPPLIGFILRPTTVPRDTYRNIKDTGVFTVNHIYSDIIEDAHHTSAKYPDEVSEFTKTGLEEEFLGDFPAPFVKGAKIRLGCRFLNEYVIKENDTLLLVSAIEHVFVADQNIQQEDGWLKLENANTVAINGLDGYATTRLLDRYAYARPKKA